MIDTKLLRQKILDLAIRGKLVPQDPTDEPASVLLERIRKEKAELVKQGKIKKPKEESCIYKDPSDNRHYENVPFEVPESWVWVMFGEVCDYGSNNTATAKQIADDAWCLDLEDIEKDTAKIQIFVTKAERPFASTKHSFKKGQVLYSKLRPYLNKVVIAPKDGYCTPEILPLAFNIPICEQYVRHVLMSPYFLAYTKICSRGIKMPRLGTNDGKKAFFSLPPLAEQKRIVVAVEAQFELISQIETAQAELTDLANLAKSKILDLAMRGKLVPQDPNDEPANELLARLSPSHKSHYEKLADLPDSWASTTLGEIGDWGAGATPKRNNQSYYGGEIVWLKTGELNNSYVFDSKEKVTALALKECSLRVNKVGDILIAMYGATIGKLAIVGRELTTNQACCACTPYKHVDNLYLFYYLLSIKNDLIDKAIGGAQPNISKEKIIRHPFCLPPLKEQKRIVSAIKSAFNLINFMND